MKLRFWLFGFLVAALLLVLPSASQAVVCYDEWGYQYPCPPIDSCLNCGSEGWDCASECKRPNGTWTTCGEFDGYPANDLDSDGVYNTSDNCICTPNLYQTDCDQDGTGDSCDAVNVKWVLVQDRGQCDWDGDVHFGSIDVEIYGEKEFRNICDDARCYQKYEKTQGTCTQTSSCGWSDAACCQCLFSSQGYCANDNNCHTQACPF